MSRGAGTLDLQLMHAHNDDPLAPIHEWPGTAVGYAFLAGSKGDATLQLEVGFDPARAGDAASALVYYQAVQAWLVDPRTAFSVTTSLAAGPLSPVTASGAGLGAALAELVEAIVASLDPVTPGSPPAPTVLTATVPVSYVTSILGDLFPIWVAIETTREALSVKWLVPPTAFRDWALGFETAFAGFDGSGGLLKVLAGDSPAPGDLRALKWSSSEGVAIGFANARGETTGAPVHFTRRPLATRLVAGDVEVNAYEPDGTVAAPTTASFTGIDMEIWMGSFLQALDRLLAPDLSAAIEKLDERSYARLIDARAAIVDALASAVSWVFEDQMPQDGKPGAGDVEAARAHFRENLLVSLGSDVTTAAIVQMPVDVIVKPPFSTDNSSRPAELVGTPTATGSWGTASTARLPAAAGKQELSFLVTATEPTGSADLCLALDHRLSGIDRHGETRSSARLHFLVVDDALSVPMGDLDIPVPLRAYPAPPGLLEQSIGARHDPPASLTQAVEASYSLRLAAPRAAQDALHLSLLFNGATFARDDPGPAPEPGPFAPLARFHDFQARYAETAVAAIEAGTPDAQRWVQDIVALVEDVAASGGSGDPHAEPPGSIHAEGTAGLPAPFAWDFVLQVPDRSKPNRLLLRWSGTGTAPHLSWPEIDGTRGTPRPDGAMVYTLGPSADTAEPTLVWTGLSVVTSQSVSAAAWIVRNESLAGCGGSRQPRTVNPGLVYTGPITTFEDPATPRLEVAAKLTIQSASLEEAVSQLVTQVVQPPSPDAQVGVSVSAAYSFADEGGLPTEVPVLEVRTAVTTAANPPPDVETPTRFAAAIEEALAAWHRDFRPSDRSAALRFSLTLLASGGDRPLVRLLDVEAPVSPSGWWPAARIRPR